MGNPYNKRPCILTNIWTGETSKADSITEFCKKQKILKGIRVGISHVLNGDWVQSGGWYLPSTLSKRYELKDIYGNNYKLTLRDWVVKYKKHHQPFLELVSGQRSELYGKITLKENPLRILGNIDNHITTEVRLRKGQRIVKAKNLKEAAINEGLCHTVFYPLATNLRKGYKGYQLQSITRSSKKALIDV